ncbi:MAG: hypothetical protein AAFU79_13065, partial [Myxococcota bacterium]
MRRVGTAGALLLSFLASLASAQEPSSTESSTVSSDPAADSGPPPYGSEDVPELLRALEAAKAAFEVAIQRWNNTANLPPGSTEHAKSSLVLREAEQVVEDLSAELELARTAPPRALVRLRREYDAGLERLEALHRSLLPEGTLGGLVRRATDEVDNLLGAQAALTSTEESSSLIEDRLSVLELLDEQTRSAEELLTLAERLETR